MRQRFELQRGCNYKSKCFSIQLESLSLPLYNSSLFAIQILPHTWHSTFILLWWKWWYFEREKYGGDSVQSEHKPSGHTQNISMDEYTYYKIKGLHILLRLLRSSVGWRLRHRLPYCAVCHCWYLATWWKRLKQQKRKQDYAINPQMILQPDWQEKTEAHDCFCVTSGLK